MVPSLQRTLGIKGKRPTVQTFDNKDLVYAFGAVNLVTGRIHTSLLDVPSGIKRKTGESKCRHLQRRFAKFIQKIGKAYKTEKRVVLVIDNAPWHGGKIVKQALSKHPHIEFYRLPSYSPKLNMIERFWKILRRRATHNRLFETMRAMRRSLRSSFSYFQTMRARLTSLIKSPRKIRTKSL